MRRFVETDTVPSTAVVVPDDGTVSLDISEIPVFVQYTGSGLGVAGGVRHGQLGTVMSLGAIQSTRTGRIAIDINARARGVMNAALYSLNGRRIVTVSRSLGAGNHKLVLGEGNRAAVGVGAYIVRTTFTSESASVERSGTVMVMGR